MTGTDTTREAFAMSLTLWFLFLAGVRGWEVGGKLVEVFLLLLCFCFLETGFSV